MIRRINGFSILEVVVALSLFALLLLTVGTYTGFSLAGLASQQNVIEAETLNQEIQPILASIAKRDWTLFNANVGSLNFSNGQWTFLGQGTVETTGIYQRRLQLSQVCRDANQLVVVCPLGVVDVGTYKYTAVITWSDWRGQQEIKQESYIAQWR